MTFKEWLELKEGILDTVDQELQISPKDWASNYITLNPPRKLVSSDNTVDTIDTPTRFKILKISKNYMVIQNVSSGVIPYEKKSLEYGKKYTISKPNIDSLISRPDGEASADSGMGGGFGGGMGGGLGS